MNWIGMLLLLLSATTSQAGEVFLIPESNPGPEYPRVLQRAGITGDVREVNAHLANVAEYSWVDSLPFHYTRGYLSNTFFQHQLSNEQRLALIAKINRQVERTVRGCRESPARKFMSLLPAEVRELL